MKTYRIKPLEWKEKLPFKMGAKYEHEAKVPFGSCGIWKGESGYWLEFHATNDSGLSDHYPCESLEAAKQLAEQHWHKTLEQVLEPTE